MSFKVRILWLVCHLLHGYLYQAFQLFIQSFFFTSSRGLLNSIESASLKIWNRNFGKLATSYRLDFLLISILPLRIIRTYKIITMSITNFVSFSDSVSPHC